MKNFLSALARHSPWPIRRLSSQAPVSATLDLLGSASAGIVVGLISAASFMLISMVLPARVALMISLGIGLFSSIPRGTLGRWAQTIGPKSALALGVSMLLKLEILSEIDLEWVPVTLICSAAWSRAAVLAATPGPLIGIRPNAGAARIGVLIVGMLPLCFFGLWPEPVWGLWVAALAALMTARWTKAQGIAAPIGVRWLFAETVYCLCVLLLMSAAAITEMAQEEAPGS